MNPRLVVAGGALGLGAVLGVPHGHQREGLHAPGAAEGHVHRGYAVTARGDAESHGPQADVGGFQKDVLHAAPSSSGAKSTRPLTPIGKPLSDISPGKSMLPCEQPPVLRGLFHYSRMKSTHQKPR